MTASPQVSKVTFKHLGPEFPLENETEDNNKFKLHEQLQESN